MILFNIFDAWSGATTAINNMKNIVNELYLFLTNDLLGILPHPLSDYLLIAIAIGIVLYIYHIFK